MEYETPRKSSGVAKAGLTLGIIGTSLAVLGANGNGFLNFGCKTSEKDAEIAELKSMRYTDQIGIDLYKAIVEKSNVEDAKIRDVHDELIKYVIDLEKRTALIGPALLLAWMLREVLLDMSLMRTSLI